MSDPSLCRAFSSSFARPFVEHIQKQALTRSLTATCPNSRGSSRAASSVRGGSPAPSDVGSSYPNFPKQHSDFAPPVAASSYARSAYGGDGSDEDEGMLDYDGQTDGGELPVPERTMPAAYEEWGAGQAPTVADADGLELGEEASSSSRVGAERGGRGRGRGERGRGRGGERGGRGGDRDVGKGGRGGDRESGRGRGERGRGRGDRGRGGESRLGWTRLSSLADFYFSLFQIELSEVEAEEDATTEDLPEETSESPTLHRGCRTTDLLTSRLPFPLLLRCPRACTTSPTALSPILLSMTISSQPSEMVAPLPSRNPLDPCRQLRQPSLERRVSTSLPSNNSSTHP